MRLNVETRHVHAEVDDRWLELLLPTVTRADYLAQLVRIYGLVAPFEAACKYTTGLDRIIDLKQLSRAGLLAQDLLTLGLSPAQVSSIPQCEAIMPFRSVPVALGWLYVIERTTLLQDGIKRHLLAHLPEVENACSYLATYEGTATEQWASLALLLHEIGARDDVAQVIIAAAQEGFACVSTFLHTVKAQTRLA